MSPVEEFGRIEREFRAKRAAGRKLLVPFVTAGMTPDWLDFVRALAHEGADAIEIGIPFSDPIMDGPVIQAASLEALQAGTTPQSVLDQCATADVGVPLLVMTSYNVAFRAGHERFAAQLQASGISGSILPDLPIEEYADWAAQATKRGIENVLLASPTTPDARLAEICERSRGWVYGVGTLGVTGERATLAATASEIASRLKAVTDRPVLIGVGISNAVQAREVAEVSDGVIVGASVVRRILEGEPAEAVGGFVRSLRDGLDGR